MPDTLQLVQVFSISTALLSSGAILSCNLFEIPILKAQPASRSLPSLRWYFSRGSHTFPQAAIAASSGFVYLTYASLPTIRADASIWQLVQHGRIPGYLLAATLAFGIAPFTALVMVPHPNFDLIQLNKALGGAASEQQAAEMDRKEGVETSGHSETSPGPPDLDQDYTLAEFKDQSGPQPKTKRDSTAEQDQKAVRLLDKFAQLNMVRALLLLGSGVAGLMTALT